MPAAATGTESARNPSAMPSVLRPACASGQTPKAAPMPTTRGHRSRTVTVQPASRSPIAVPSPPMPAPTTTACPLMLPAYYICSVASVVVVPTRRETALDAAIEVIGTGGSRALTHRAVDQAGGLPEGTTSNYFRTREALLAGVLAHISRAETAPLDGMLPSTGLTVDALVAISAERIEYLLGPGRTLTLARHALFLEASWNPELRPDLLVESQQWRALGTALLTQLDCPDPARRSRWLFAYIDGLLADQLARPDPDFDAAAAVRAAVHGLLRVGPS